MKWAKLDRTPAQVHSRHRRAKKLQSQSQIQTSQVAPQQQQQQQQSQTYIPTTLQPQQAPEKAAPAKTAPEKVKKNTLNLITTKLALEIQPPTKIRKTLSHGSGATQPQHPVYFDDSNPSDPEKQKVQVSNIAFQLVQFERCHSN